MQKDTSLDDTTLELYTGEALEKLVRTASSGADPHLRRFSIYQLGVLKDPAYKDLFIAALRDPDKGVRGQAAMALAELGEAAEKDLLVLLRDGDWRIRYRAAEALGLVGSVSAKDDLISALGDEKDHVRYMAAKSLGLLEAGEAVMALGRRLSDGNSYVRRISAVSLGKIGDSRARSLLLAARAAEKDPVVKKAITEAIENTG